MEWTQREPGKFVQDFGGVEKIYRHISQIFKPTGREHWGLYCVCTLDCSLLLSTTATTSIETALRNSWTALRHEFPRLAVVPEGDTTKSYEVPTTESIQQWVKETFFSEKTSTPDDILAAYPLKDTPTLYFFPASMQILLLSSHWRVDALGLCMLLDRFFDLLAAATSLMPPAVPHASTSSLQRISLPIEDAFGAPSIEHCAADPEIEEFARQYIQHHHKAAVNAGGLPFKRASVPGQPARTAIHLNRASTAAFVKACKAREFTVTSAVHAALADTFFALNDSIPTPPESYTAVMSVNMRSHLKPPYNGKEHAVQTYVTGITPSVDRKSTFEEKVKVLKASYNSWYSEKFLSAMRLTTKLHYDAMKNRPSDVADTPPPKPSSSVTLSSLGVVEEYLRVRHGEGDSTVEVTGFRFGVSMMTPQMLLYVWTFSEKLCLSVNYNDAYHDASEGLEFLDFIRQVLQKELGILLELEA